MASAPNPWEGTPQNGDGERLLRSSGSIAERTRQFTDSVNKLDPQRSWETRSEVRVSSRSLRSGARSSTCKSLRSNLSSASSRKADAVANAAALETRLKFLDEEIQLKGKLEKLQTIKELQVAKSQVEALTKLEHEDSSGGSSHESLPLSDEDKTAYVQNYVRSLAAEAGSYTPAPVISPPECFSDTPVPNEPDALPEGYSSRDIAQPPLDGLSPNPQPPPTSPYTPQPPPTSLNPQNQEFGPISSQLQSILNIGRLKVPEPGMFTGNPLEYLTWKRAFETLIENKGVNLSERLYFLKKYLAGEAKDCVEGFFMSNSTDAYQQARGLLEERYGDPFMVASAFRQKLDAWPKIQSKDSLGLRKFADFLRQCHTAMISNQALQSLNDVHENQKLLKKLPEWIVHRWARVIATYKKENGKFPPFSKFTSFITNEANIACEPSLIYLSSKEKPEEKGGKVVKPARVGSTGAKPAPVCVFCGKEGHEINKCRGFCKEDLKQRKAYAVKQGLCFGCLKKGHLAKQCKNRLSCETCSKRHPTALHGDVREKQQEESGTAHASISHDQSGTKASMIVPVWLSHPDASHEELVYALLDTQSDTTFVLDEVLCDLNIEGHDVKLSLSTMTESDRIVDSKRINGLQVRAYDGLQKLSLPSAYTRNIMPANRSHIPTPETAEKWPHLKRIADKLMPLSDCKIGLLIGYNCSRALAPREVILPESESHGPFGQRTDLGWGIVGIIDHREIDVEGRDPIGVSHHVVTCEKPSWSKAANSQIAFRSSVKEVINPHQVIRMMELDFNDARDHKTMSQEDRRFLKSMEGSIHVNSDGHYEMPLPFKQETPVKLPNNKPQALQRLTHLKKRLEKDRTYKQDYYNFMNNIIEKEYAEEVPESELEKAGHTVWYIPHHGVYSSKKPDKIRIVFDCSARYQGQALNDHLLQGPDLINGLIGVLCRFRSEPIAIICDVEQMFFQFSVEPCHRDFLRFFWWKDDNMMKPVEYRMKVHLFGAVSSPGCANFALKKVADDNEEEFGFKAAEFIRQDFYVDDGLTSVCTVQKAVDLIHSTRNICAQGGLHLHKFVSNSAEVMSTIPLEDRAQTAKDINLCDTMPLERALGVQWCIESDSFQFRIILKDQPVTRRGILSTISSIFDPLGFLAPVMLLGKQILQEMCKEGCDWDSDLPETLKARWERWRKDLSQLVHLGIKRCCKPDNFGEVKRAELHHFSDASTGGYGQCSYLRLVNQENQVHCTLMMGKARVTPLKVVTIPRLELMAAVVSVRVSNLLGRELRFAYDLEETFWTDSKIVLGYILNESRRFHVFVGNRVQQIRDSTDPMQWRYVKTEENPADDASRGITPHDLMTTSKWLSGPDFLWNEDISVTETLDPEPIVSPNDPEVKTVSSATCVEERPGCLHPNRLEYFSSWSRARRAVANCMRFKARLKHRVLKEKSAGQQREIDMQETLTVLNLCHAEKEIIKGVQAEVFQDEVKILASMKLPPHTPDRKNAKERNIAMKGSSTLFRLDPFLDKDGIMRVGGRIRRAALSDQIKHPVIMPGKHHITELLIRHFHEKTGHQGRGLTTNELRANGFWIVGCSSAVSSYLSKCVKCRKYRSALLNQKMADLPEDRLEPAPPFTYCAVDYFGPWLVKEKRSQVKRYGVLFTCMASRAIHLETANAMTTDSFINALRRFIAIRGPIRQLRSDCGTNFVGAKRELLEALNEMDMTRVHNYLLKESCDFIFKMNPPAASHMGGVWERQIRTVRSVLSALMDESGPQLDDESLRTLMHEVTAIVNSRPLTVENLNDPSSCEPLTPNHILTMKTKVILPPPGQFQRADMYLKKQWRRVQHLANEFWFRWKREYLQSIQSRRKWNRERRNLQQGDLVLISDDNTPRNHWPLARVEEVFKDADDSVRRVKVALSDKSLDSKGQRVHSQVYLERPIHKLVLLLETTE